MLGIVETDTKDILARARDWREQADIASGQRGADQVGGRRRRNGVPQEAQYEQPNVDKLEHRRRQILPERIAQIFAFDPQTVREKAEPGCALARAISRKTHRECRPYTSR